MYVFYDVFPEFSKNILSERTWSCISRYVIGLLQN